MIKVSYDHLGHDLMLFLFNVFIHFLLDALGYSTYVHYLSVLHSLERRKYTKNNNEFVDATFTPAIVNIPAILQHYINAIKSIVECKQSFG